MSQLKDLVINDQVQFVKAFAPGSSANLAVGFDSLGLALADVGDRVCLVRRSDNRLRIVDVSPGDHLPKDVGKNTAGIAIESLIQAHKIKLGLDIYIEKGIALGSGMGGSAASAVAALVALNGFFITPLTHSALLPFAIEAEAAASGVGHADNVLPSLLGGLVLLGSDGPLSLPINDVVAVVAHPNICIETKMARELLPHHILFDQHVDQVRRLASFVALLHNQQYQRAFSLCQDTIIEPARASLWPYYPAVKQAALDGGAWMVCMSGSGPSVIAFVAADCVDRVSVKIAQSLEDQGYVANLYHSQLPAPGAMIEQRNLRMAS